MSGSMFNPHSDPFSSFVFQPPSCTVASTSHIDPLISSSHYPSPIPFPFPTKPNRGHTSAFIPFPNTAPNRRPSLAAVSPAVSGRRLSSGITPNVATPSVDNNNAESRRGSLRDLPNERDAFGAALRQYDRDLKSGKHTHCTYPAIRQRLSSTLADVLPATIAKGKEIITLDGSTDPVEAFDALIDSGLEAIPVTVSQHHSHNADGTITIHSSHQQFPTLYKQAKENKEKATIAAAQAPSAPTGSTDSPTTSPTPTPATPISPKPLGLGSFSTPAKHSIHDQVIVIDPVTLIPTFQPASSASLSLQTHNTALSTTVTSPGNPLGSTPARSLRDSLGLPQNSQGPVAGCSSDCPFRQAAGWLDIRDLASSIVYVYQQPVNEDLLEFREGGVVEQQPLVINTRGLDGITDLPGLTKSSSYSSHHSTDEDPSNTSSLHPSLPEEPTNIDSMAIVYEDDRAKAQGLELKANYQQHTRSQGGFSHRLSLAPMMEEEDTFDLSAIKTVEDAPVAPSTPSSASNNNAVASDSDSKDGASSQGESRSRSQSRHRRKMISADELSSEFTEGGQQAWLNTLKHGLGKFSAVGNISTAYLSRRHPLRSVKSSSSLYDIFKLLSANHAHRVVLVDDKTGKMVDIISHRTVIKYLWAHRDEFFALSKPGQDESHETITDGDETSEVEPSMDVEVSAKSLLEKQIDDLNVGTRNLIQIRNDILGLDALQEMDEHSRTGLAVVDDCGRLIGATSARTIKRITNNRDHRTMSKPLLAFIEQADEDLQEVDDADEGCMVSHGAVVLLDDEVTFKDVLSAMYKHNTNRVFLVDEESYPTKVISLSDILQLILY